MAIYSGPGIVVVSLTDAGRRIAKMLEHHLHAHAHGQLVECWHKPKPFAVKVQQAFVERKALLMICATGIAVRTLAPVIKSKLEDPPVLVLDENANYVIPLLSGHEGGANDLASKISGLINAQMISTTANAYINPIYTVGMGCERNCPVEELDGLLTHCLAQAGVEPEQLHSVNSIALKHDEVGLIALAQQYEKPFQVFSAEQLNEMDALLVNRSDYVFKTVGVYGVAESAALYSVKQASDASHEPELILAKQKTSKATCAIARSYLNEVSEL